MLRKKEIRFILNKAFFGRINCLKILMNSENEIYFHLGLINEDKKTWDWKKVKMSLIELGEIINTLKKVNGSCSFFHSFKDNKTQIWCRKSEDLFNIKIGTVSKNLSKGEFEILKIILEECIKVSCFNWK